jgi:DNA repair exonuclease SbcCD ATPase subunit
MGNKIKIKRIKPAVSYCGSLVQQNHGELLEKHGYLLWDVATRTYTEHHIHNDYGFLTIDVVDGKIPQWVYDEIDTVLPKYPRLRLRFTNTQAAQMKLCITELKHMFKVAEVTVTRTDTIGQLKTNNKLNKNIVGEVKDITFQNQLIRDYLERQFLLADDELNHITDINIEVNSRINDSDSTENILWTPISFEFDNMFSYGENNKITFTNAHGIIGLFAPNASGKSAIWDALSFCIYDRTSRTNSSQKILNNRKNGFFCKFNFEIDGVQYYIERVAKWTRKKTNLKVDVKFWKEDGGIIESLNGEQRRETNRNIEKYLGKFEDFILTTLSLQGNNALFIDKSQSERKEILSQFIGVDIFDKLFQIANDENKDNSTLIRKFKQDDFTGQLASFETKYTQHKNEYKFKTIESNVIANQLEQLNKDLIRLNGKLVKHNVDIVDIEQLEKRKKALTDKELEISNQKTTIEERIGKLEVLQVQLDELIDTFDDENLESELNHKKSILTTLNRIKIEIDKLEIKKESAVTQLTHLESHKYNPECDICLENSKSIISTKKEVETTLELLNNELTTYKSDYITKKQGYDALPDYEAQWKSFKETELKETQVERELASLITRLSTLETDEVRISSQLKQQNSLIEEYYKNEEQIKKNKVIRDELTLVRDTLTTTKAKEKTLNAELLTLNGKVSAVATQKEVIQARIKEVKDLEEQTRLYDYYLNALNKDGVSYELIEKALPMIEGEINNILAQIVDFGMQLDIEGRNINAFLVYGDNRWPLELCSGMERFISGIAIRVALINVCNLPRPNFLVIDEGFGALDSEHMQSLYMLFTYLKTQFDFVMIVSHIDSMRDVVDNLIEVKKIEGFSHVKF